MSRSGVDLERLHFEPFVHLADVDDDQALIAWGGFLFAPFLDGHGTCLIDDEALPQVANGRHESVGARSEPYGHAVVEAVGPDGEVVARAETSEVNHVWLRGLRPDTEYRYSVRVDGREWAAGERMGWHRLDAERGELRPAGRGYDLRFRTFPNRESDAGITFCALGDYGTGIQHGDEIGISQTSLARAMEAAVEHDDVRVILTLGDNIYHGSKDALGGSGGEDDDWYFSYYEPYRWLISRVPVYPAVGNHDSQESEESDDREQLSDNHYLDLRFRKEVEEGRASLDPGLFYRLDYSARVSFLCLDTSHSDDERTPRFFAADGHLAFIAATLARAGGLDRGSWCVPFGHHPPFCAGPAHQNDRDMIDRLVPRFEQHGVRLVLSGHEHNFQYSVHHGVHYVVSGAGGKLRADPPERFDDAHTVAWAAAGHVLLVRIEGERCSIRAISGLGEDGTLQDIAAQRPDGSPFRFPIEITR